MFIYILIVFLFVSKNECHKEKSPQFPTNLQGSWFSWEEGYAIDVTIDEDQVYGWGRIVTSVIFRYDIRDYLFQKPSGCFICSRFHIRSWNILERVDSSCESLNITGIFLKSLEKKGCELFSSLKKTTHHKGTPKGYIMYRETPSPVNCRYSIYGSYKVSYQIQDSFTGECGSYNSLLHSCNSPGTQFFIANQKFILNFGKCEGMKESFESTGEFTCLGEWRVGMDHFFVVANLRESRKEERYRCFLKDREDPYYLGMSRSPSCEQLRTPHNSPIRLRLDPFKKEIHPTCFFASNISGTWMSSADGEPLVHINETHLVETRLIGNQVRKDVHVCIQSKGTRFQLAKISEEGCQVEYVCWDLLPRHQNIIRFRKSRAVIRNNFDVCDFSNFRGDQHWKYNTLIANIPQPIECPFSGRFTFGQKGMGILTPKIDGGITTSPLDTYKCLDRRADFSICDQDRKNIIIDLEYCYSLNTDGQPMDVKSIPDYRMQCVGFWKEDLASYLVTHDPFDSVSKFKCWVYQRVSLTEVRLSQGLGSSCGLKQTHLSYEFKDGASLVLNLTLNERLYDACPLFYDDGSNPWKEVEASLKIFTFVGSSAVKYSSETFLVFIYILFSLITL